LLILSLVRDLRIASSVKLRITWETEERELLKDPTMLRRLNDIAKFPENDKNCILYTIDAMINNVKLKGLNV